MEKTTRRRLLQAAAVGGATAVGLSAALGTERGVAALGAADQKSKNDDKNEGEHGHGHDDRPLSGRRSHVVVSFGQWDVDAANHLDRQPTGTDLENRVRNVHRVLPFEAEIEEGGAVSFIISGLHQILIYGPDRTLEEVQAGAMGLNIPGVPPLVDYAVGRVYRGLDPRVLQYPPIVPQPPDTTGFAVLDRVESVNFKERGRYLVVCGVRPHFDEGMHGYVRVRR
jgi:hypothetical protein